MQADQKVIEPMQVAAGRDVDDGPPPRAAYGLSNSSVPNPSTVSSVLPTRRRSPQTIRRS
jgi:hypothetical protein